MIIPFIEKYNVQVLRLPQLNLSKWYSPINGTIRRLRVVSPNSNLVGGQHHFNIALDGVYLYTSNVDDFQINGPNEAEKTGLSIAIEKGQTLTWDLVRKGQNAVGVPIFFEVDIEPDDLPGRREVISFTTASLADGATENADLSIGKSGYIWKVVADRSTRVRLYDSAAYRTADAARAIGTDPEDEHGVQMDLYLTPSNLTWDVSTMVPFKDTQATPTGIVKAAIENKSGSTAAVDLDFYTIQLED